MSSNRRALLKSAASLMLLPVLPRRLLANAAANTTIHRVRPPDAAWPSQAAWKRLNDEVGGNLLSVGFPLDTLKASTPAAGILEKQLRNPYWIAD